MKRKLWIPLALVVALLVVVLPAAIAAAVAKRIPEYLISGHRCSDAEARFARSLGRDPLLKQPPKGVSPIAQQPLDRPFQPCEGNSDNRYYGGASLGFDLPRTDPSLAEIEAHYRALATANGWEVTKPAAGELVGRKRIGGTAVVFSLGQLEHSEHNTAYWIELRYAELGSSRYLLTIQDTF